MAVQILESGIYSGLYTDTKPTAPSGYRFYETDTYDTLVSDGTFWWNTTSFNPHSPRRWGSMGWGASATVGVGTISGVTAATGTGSQTYSVDATNGKYLNNPSLTTIGNRGGFRINSSGLTRYDQDPRIRFKFQLPAATDHTLARLYLGFAEQAERTGDDPLNADQGVMVGFISGGTDFKIIRNDDVGVTLFSDPGGAAKTLDEVAHEVSIVSDSVNSRWAVKWDAGAYDFFTTEIPTGTMNVTIHFMIETNETAVAKTVRLYNMLVQTER
jgi:hypothetical protein